MLRDRDTDTKRAYWAQIFKSVYLIVVNSLGLIFM